MKEGYLYRFVQTLLYEQMSADHRKRECVRLLNALFHGFSASLELFVHPHDTFSHRNEARRWRRTARSIRIPKPFATRCFTGNPFFYAKDLVQVRYKMVRRYCVNRVAVSEASAKFGVSRPTFYKAHNELQKAGLPGLLPSRHGPKGGHKVSAKVVASWSISERPIPT